MPRKASESAVTRGLRAGFVPASVLLEELECHLGRLIRLREDSHRRLLQDLGTRHLGNGSGDVGIADTTIRGEIGRAHV